MESNHNSSNLPIEFVVKPKEDLYLEGSLRKIPRVYKEDPYPCQMQKNQTFSCLFRHYAKHNGLKKEDLVFFFVDQLLPDQMPETVQLMHHDEIWVEHRKKPLEDIIKLPNLDIETFAQQIGSLLQSKDHYDVTFLVGDLKKEVFAHKSILSARSEYFAAMFRHRNISEIENKSIIEIPDQEHNIFLLMFEFLYTNSIKDLDECSSRDLISLLMISNEFLLDGLRILCEQSASKVLAFENIGKFILLSNKHNAIGLRNACKKYVKNNLSELNKDNAFRQEISESPELGLLLFDFSQEEEQNDNLSMIQLSSKKRRLSNTELVPIEVNTTTIQTFNSSVI